MMEWHDQALVLAARPHGETSAILTVFAREHGRCSGLVRGGASRRLAAHLQPGNELDLTWTARLEDQLGSFRVEPLRSRAAVLADRLALEGLGAVTALLQLCLPEREAYGTLWQETQDLLDQMTRTGPVNASWPAYYLLWELRFLTETGYGLDLGSCAVTGATEGLAYVSPRTGRAVSARGAGDWAARLLPLPASLAAGGMPGEADILPGLALTGHFLTRELLNDRPRPADDKAPPVPAALPAARGRLIDLLARTKTAGPAAGAPSAT
ncbi:DNA repair protein RecO [Paracoccus sp. IB05]|uniref:DNA repair protein RecO n=1 Tax=Paracoccus sp. IB05 TaxID=2779367 RepID=UPI0018E75E58|nr:DNA repair protein RecO [Paracoccus sp. IB05]MBJ2150384.1 DNA repair protein RecO [Paracoccus sp. IB05]